MGLQWLAFAPQVQGPGRYLNTGDDGSRTLWRLTVIVVVTTTTYVVIIIIVVVTTTTYVIIIIVVIATTTDAIIVIIVIAAALLLGFLFLLVIIIIVVIATTRLDGYDVGPLEVTATNLALDGEFHIPGSQRRTNQQFDEVLSVEGSYELAALYLA